MAATLGLSNMSSSYPSLRSSMYQTSEFSYHDQAYAINGSIHPIGSSELGYCEILSSSDNKSEKPESMIESTRNEASKIKTNEQRCSRIGFRTKSEVDVLDDGFKWRKYGKKAVKNSPNPRNYYRCTIKGCKVKKRVERDRNDPSYVITTYEGVHNHLSPGTVLYENYNYFPYRGDFME
ncbi:putative WRKY transcription factor 50 [Carex littledalei]|uniref:Putative WRKY transcription factor 50 n=1 Tax=Carex littledalei TaxID=544730 RepID=A0A833VKK5_9POAL|nr:putative WRKY transcription factor 50 [Carex littledalei]